MEETIISIKDYAKSRNRTVQGVYQQISRKNNAELLKEHIITKEVGNRKVKFLDEYAVKVLDQSRNSVPAVIISTDKDEEIQALQVENKNLLVKVAEQADKIAQQAEQLSSHQQLLLESQSQLATKDQAIQQQQTEIEAKEAAIKELEAKISELESNYNAEKGRKLTFRERLYGRKNKE